LVRKYSLPPRGSFLLLEKAADSAKLLRRLRGVLVAREYVIMDYDCPKTLVEKASAITPGIESPYHFTSGR
jgi:ATP phosphoribosyltransferase-like protein